MAMCRKEHKAASGPISSECSSLLSRPTVLLQLVYAVDQVLHSRAL